MRWKAKRKDDRRTCPMLWRRVHDPAERLPPHQSGRAGRGAARSGPRAPDCRGHRPACRQPGPPPGRGGGGVGGGGECGSVQIRTRATLAGNIANAAAAADMIPPLLLAGARIAGLTQGGAECEISLQDYQAGAGMLITTVILLAEGFGPDSAFVKLGPRRDLTIARLN